MIFILTSIQEDIELFFGVYTELFTVSKKAERIKIAQRIISSEKFTYDEIAYFTNLTLEKIKTLTNNEKGPAL